MRVLGSGLVRVALDRHFCVVLTSDLRSVVTYQSRHPDGAEYLSVLRTGGHGAALTDEAAFKDAFDPDRVRVSAAALRVFARECLLSTREAQAEVRVALREAVEGGTVRVSANPAGDGREDVFVLEDDEFRYWVFSDGKVVFRVEPL